MKKIFYLLVLALMPMCFTACGGDDDSSGAGSNDIVGTWQLIRTEGWEDSSDNSYDITYGDAGPVIIFNLDGTYKSGDKQGNYTYSNGVLTMENVTMKATVSGDILVIESSTKIRYEKSTLRRVGPSSGSSGSEDPNPNPDADVANLIGLWEMIHIKGVTVDDDGNVVNFDQDVNPSTLTKVEELDVCDYVRYRFDQGNAFTCYTYNGSGWVDDNTATWRYSDGILTMEHPNYKDEMKVLSLTKDRLVLYEKVNDSHESYELTATFKRIE